MIESLVLLWLAALALMGSPGPATVSLAGVGAAFGVRRGLRYLAGIIVGTVGVLIMIATGVTGLVLAHPAVVTGLTAVAGAYIVYLAWKIATAPAHAHAASATAPALSPGFVLAISNPKAFAAIGAVYASHTLIDDALLADTLAKLLALTLVIVTVNTAWLIFGASLSTVLSNPRAARIVNVTFAAMLIVSVAVAVFRRVP